MAYIHPDDVEEFLHEVRGYLDVEVALGFWGRDKMVEVMMNVAGLAEYGEDEQLQEQLRKVRGQVGEMAEELLQESKEKQSSWPEVTDCDRLDEAFRALEADRILSGHRFGPDPAAGHWQVRGLIEELPEANRPVGYVFTDEEAIFECLRSKEMELNFGAVSDSAKEVREVGRQVVERLTEAGLRGRWDGDAGRIRMERFAWRRRLK